MGAYLYYIPLKIASLSWLFSLLLLISPPVESAEIRLPSLGGDSTVSVMTPQQEQLLGEAFMRALRKQIDIIEEAEIHHYIETLGQQLVLQSDDPTAPFEFFVVRDQSINAFAGPAGKIGIHTGLIEKAESEGELAAVVAHEIAHVTQRHLMRAFESQQQQPLLTAATVLATIIAASASPQAGEAMIATSAGLSLQQQINFTRSNEQEADRVGMEILHGADYRPMHMTTFFKRLQQASRHESESLPEYLRTHPLNLSRIADAESRLGRYPSKPPRDSEEFYRIRSLLQIEQFTHPEAAIRHFQQQLAYTDPPQPSNQFGLAVAYLQADRPSEALPILQTLHHNSPDTPTILLQLARAEIALKQPQKALKRLGNARRLYPTHIPLLLLQSELLHQQGQSAQAIQTIEEGIGNHPLSTMLYQQLALIHTQANHPVQSHLAQGHYHYLRGETKAALRQLDFADRAAKSAETDFILFSTIDARRRLYEEKETIEKAEEKRS